MQVNTTIELGKESPWYTCSCPDNWMGLNCDVYTMMPTPTNNTDIGVNGNCSQPKKTLLHSHNAQGMTCSSATSHDKTNNSECIYQFPLV